LRQNLSLYREIFETWVPALTCIDINCVETSAKREKTNRVGCFFSGGVDSFFSFVRNQNQITDLILCKGLDIPLSEEKRWKYTVDNIQQLAAAYNKNVIIVETNAKKMQEYFQNDYDRFDNHGAVLISSAMLLGLDKVIVPASFSYNQLFSWGSHPVLDPLLSSANTEIIHDGAVSRIAKTRFLIEKCIDLRNLRVCNVASDYNCGKCEKCLRTMVAIELLGGHAASLPKLPKQSLANIKIWDRFTYEFWVENYDLALEVGDKHMASQIKRILRSWQYRVFLKHVDAKLFRGMMLATWRRVRS
jgi:hypothetical protein